MKIGYLTKNIILGFTGLIIIIIFLLIVFPALHLSIWWTLGFCLLALLIAGWLLNRTKKFSSGQIGEFDVGDELKSLDTNFISISDINTGRGNIDKIVIGPTGVWTLEVKSYKGNIIPSEHDLKQAYAEAKTLQDLIMSKLNLNINVQPVLVFSDKFAKVKFGLNKQSGVYVIQKTWLKKLLTETHEQSLDNENAKRIGSIIFSE